MVEDRMLFHEGTSRGVRADCAACSPATALLLVRRRADSKGLVRSTFHPEQKTSSESDEGGAK